MGCLASKLVSAEKAAEALKDALLIAVREAVKELGKEGGFKNSEEHRIKTPSTVGEIIEKLKALPNMAEAFNPFEDKQNAAAEAAIQDSETILKDLVAALDFEDALKVLEGDVDAAVAHLRKSLEPKLIEDFTPIVKAKLEESEVIVLYEKIKHAFEAIPFNNTTLDCDMAEHVVKHAIDALFKEMIKVETAIRTNKDLHETQAMKEAFGQIVDKAAQKENEEKKGEEKKDEEKKDEEKKEEAEEKKEEAEEKKEEAEEKKEEAEEEKKEEAEEKKEE